MDNYDPADVVILNNKKHVVYAYYFNLTYNLKPPYNQAIHIML